MTLDKVKNIVILGAGESGCGAALLAATKGFRVFVSDAGEIKPEYLKELQENHIDFEQKQHSTEKILGSDLIIKSPGIPEKAEIMQQIRHKGIPVISEIEFASHFTHAKIIGITGSNGKTTTTSLIYHILQTAGLNAGLGGNIGKSFARLLLEKTYDYIVLELSSFQLDDIADFKCHIAVLLNITPDHLDRYHYDIGEYARSKYKIGLNQTENDFFIYNADDKISMDFIGELKKNQAVRLPVTMKFKPETGVYTEENQIIVKTGKQVKTSIDMNILSLVGTHNRYNSMAASAAAKALNIKDEDIREALAGFKNIEHRLEFVARVHGKEFINDSKATNVNSVWYALESMVHPVVWIAGGIDKGNNYAELLDLVKEKVKAIVCLGLDNSKIIDFFSPYVDLIFETDNMQEAVEISYKVADPGDVVLLSPACASFDLFKNYEDRGNQFKEAVRNL
ncbi:MAG TPA: UDP-N-acetylmuramoyl-L-alanine--D-glutamate ligase [Bacteroidia bacterium]|nr:UDP-N-acetylmuramoyl-L-alanine--D-glutamate ligase [Bacteroidia bacterium]HRS58648.1 UDP-N-acetylmuramoyl-L-alanine--D-glutamate ligase [Bacteroidia bacterium]HRU67855.1 UDP-N-acetylmuramoyl-L-alanine--D-glutamate ligase [Bacteroidia bacterium]